MGGGYSCALAPAVATAESRGLLELFALFRSHRFPPAPVTALMPAAASPESAKQDAAQNQQPQRMRIIHGAAADECSRNYRVPKQHDHQTEKGRRQHHQKRPTPISRSVPHLYFSFKDPIRRIPFASACADTRPRSAFGPAKC